MSDHSSIWGRTQRRQGVPFSVWVYIFKKVFSPANNVNNIATTHYVSSFLFGGSNRLKMRHMKFHMAMDHRHTYTDFV
jgi:hypothetical protein